MSENEEQPTGGISRRTVTKAMAWAVPAIAIAAPVPAFAASGGSFTLSGAGCKLPGNSNSIYKGYAFQLSMSNTTDNPITLDVLTITLGTTDLGGVSIVNLQNGNSQSDPFLIPANTSYPSLALLTQNAANSANGTLTITYKINGGITQTVTATVTSAPPINGASCSTFTAQQKLLIANATGGLPPAWAPNTAYAIGDTVSVTGGFLTAIVAGTSGTTQPTFPGAGNTVVDNTVTWQAPC